MSKKKLKKLLIYIPVLIVAAFFFIPLLWMISTSLKGSEEIFISPPRWIPKNINWKNYKDDLTKVIINGKKSDTNFTNSVIAKVLKKYNVKVVDKAFSAILDQYVTGSGASSSSSSSSSK